MAKISKGGMALTVTSALALALTGCSDSSHIKDVNTEHAQVCQDKDSGKRLDDKECESPSHHSGAAWYYLPLFMNSSRVPPVGSSLTGGSYNRPNSFVSKIPSDGGEYYNSKSSNKSAGKDYSSGKSYTSSNAKGGVYGGKGGGSGS